MTDSICMRMRNPPHPGLVLREYLGDIPVSTAAHLRITRVTLSRVLNGKAGISANMAIRLAAALGTSAEFWMNMQGQSISGGQNEAGNRWCANSRTLPNRRKLANRRTRNGDI